MRHTFAALLAAMALIALAGCTSPFPPSTGAAKNPSPAPQGIPAVQNVRKAVQRTVDANEMRGLALSYVSYREATGKAPASWEEFKPTLERDNPKAAKAVLEGHYIIVYNVNEFSNDAVVAYVSEPVQGRRWVAKASGAAAGLSEQEFQQLMKK